MFTCEISNARGFIRRQVLLDKATVLQIVEQYLLSEDLMSPLEHLLRFNEVILDYGNKESS